MPIRLFLPNSQSFAPEDIANMSAAFEAALGKLGLVDRSDPATTAVVKLIIEFAKRAFAIRSSCARWHCSNYRGKPAQELWAPSGVLIPCAPFDHGGNPRADIAAIDWGRIRYAAS